MEKPIAAPVHKIETFGLVDGPGVRFVVFLSGCALRCRYCHNPDTWDGKAPLRTPAEVFSQAVRYKPYWKPTGGLTVSGGEPLLHLSFVKELFRLAKMQQIHTALDTAGQPFTFEEPWFSAFQELMNVTDLFLLDLKMMDPEKHRALTGAGNDNIKAMASYLSEQGKPMWIRRVIVPGLTDEPEDLLSMKAFLSTLHTVERVELLPYHTLGIPKWEAAGLSYSLQNALPPTPEQMEAAKAVLGLS